MLCLCERSRVISLLIFGNAITITAYASSHSLVLNDLSIFPSFFVSGIDRYFRAFFFQSRSRMATAQVHNTWTMLKICPDTTMSNLRSLNACVYACADVCTYVCMCGCVYICMHVRVRMCESTCLFLLFLVSCLQGQ